MKTTVYDTDEWSRVWAGSGIERQKVLNEHDPAEYLLEYSPFWRGYEIDTGIDAVWERPVVTIGSVYSVFGPNHLADDPDRVGQVVDDALDRARAHHAHGVLVFNLDEDAARRWAAVREPDLWLRLDNAYHRTPGEGADPVMGDVAKKPRSEWRRRWRRTTEAGVRLVEERDPDPDRVAEIMEFANTSAVRHDWPVLYDLPTMTAALATPAGVLIRADLDGRSVGGFIALEHEHQLHLWVGGMDHAVAGEVSPYLFLLYELLASGEERGRTRIEFGRGNDEFKRRYGFVGRPLWSLWYPASEDDARYCGPRLRALHDGLARCQGS